MRSLDINLTLQPPPWDQEDIKSNVIFNLHRLPLEMQGWPSEGEHLKHPGK